MLTLYSAETKYISTAYIKAELYVQVLLGSWDPIGFCMDAEENGFLKTSERSKELGTRVANLQMESGDLLILPLISS